MTKAETIGMSRREQPFFRSFREIRDQGERILSESLTLDELLTREYLPYARASMKSWKTTKTMFRRPLALEISVTLDELRSRTGKTT